MLSALTDLPTCQFNNSLSNADLSFLADVNGDQTINNADLQVLLALLAGGGGSEAVTKGVATVKQDFAAPFSVPSATLSKVNSELAPSAAICLPLATPTSLSTASIRLSHGAAFIGPLPPQATDLDSLNSAKTTAVDRALSSVASHRARHVQRGVEANDDITSTLS